MSCFRPEKVFDKKYFANKINTIWSSGAYSALVEPFPLKKTDLLFVSPEILCLLLNYLHNLTPSKVKQTSVHEQITRAKKATHLTYDRRSVIFTDIKKWHWTSLGKQWFQTKFFRLINQHWWVQLPLEQVDNWLQEAQSWCFFKDSWAETIFPEQHTDWHRPSTYTNVCGSTTGFRTSLLTRWRLIWTLAGVPTLCVKLIVHE